MSIFQNKYFEYISMNMLMKQLVRVVVSDSIEEDLIQDLNLMTATIFKKVFMKI